MENNLVIEIMMDSVTLCGRPLSVTSSGETMLVALYREYVGDYPKFFKMDMLSRLGFIASELLLQEERRLRPEVAADEERAVVVCSRHASIYNDHAYEQTIAPDNYFPSPALFVYTLPNVVTGEIAIRNHYLGETSCFVFPNEETSEAFLADYVPVLRTSVLGGWLDVDENGIFNAKLQIWNN